MHVAFIYEYGRGKEEEGDDTGERRKGGVAKGRMKVFVSGFDMRI